MEEPQARHERIRFNRGDHARLDDFPSASTGQAALPYAGPRRRVWAVAGWSLLAILLLVLAVPAGLVIFGLPKAGEDRLRREAEAALTRIVGRDVDASFADPRISFDGARLLGIQIDELRIANAATDRTILAAGKLSVGLRAAPLLSGDLKLASAGVSDARIDLASLPAARRAAWLESVKDEHGLIDPRLVMRETFAALNRTIDAIEQASARRLDLENVQIDFPIETGLGPFRIVEGEVLRAADGSVSYAVSASFEGKTLDFEGVVARDSRTRRIATFSNTLTVPSFDYVRQSPIVKPHTITGITGGASLTLSGAEADAGAGRLALSVSVDGATVSFGDGVTSPARASWSGFLDENGRKLEIEKAELNMGRSRLIAHGAVGPAPAGDGDAPHYRFELVSDGSLIAPEGANEPDVTVFARAAGSIDQAISKIFANQIGVRTNSGEAMGSATVDLVPGKAPGLIFQLDVPSISVSHAKQLWPWFAAAPAQKWAAGNVFGGQVRDSRLEIDVKPGRIGDGVPLGRDEIAGHFEIYNTRFDVAGEIPPVRDSVGVVDFRGTDVDIELKSGTAYLPTGRTVAAKKGTFVIRRGELPPVIGELDIDIAGSADAVAELATYKPIDALRQLPIAPDDLSGSVSGHVKASIPLQKGADFARQNWSVKLDYQNLAISKPFQGQMVAAADGTIDVDPKRAVINAAAKLNGIPATIAMTEPLGADKQARSRDISLTLDDKTREAVAPGLSALLSGPVTLKLTGSQSPQRVTADLKAARLTVPWIGWSKGAGVPATVSFALSPNGSQTTISDFKLAGGTFSAQGSATVSKSGLVRADLARVRLNRNDDVAVSVERSGGGYAVKVKGESLDVRALIKQVMADGGVAKDVKSGAASVRLDAAVGYVTGFGGESLSNVKISYSGSGALDLTASTRSGGQLMVSDGVRDKRRNIAMASSDAGAVLRFLDLYPYMRRGQIQLKLSGTPGETLSGQVDARNFSLVNEPRLQSMVSTRSNGSQSLNDAVKRDIDTSVVQFERGFARLEKGDKYLKIADGALRGPLLGTTFQGTLYDRDGNMSITGTFMPAYGLNSLFAEIPIVGMILGNGRDRGLIGITYKVSGDVRKPNVQVNPISAIAPGIFRNIFEFN